MKPVLTPNFMFIGTMVFEFCEFNKKNGRTETKWVVFGHKVVIS